MNLHGQLHLIVLSKFTTHFHRQWLINPATTAVTKVSDCSSPVPLISLKVSGNGSPLASQRGSAQVIVQLTRHLHQSAAICRANFSRQKPSDLKRYFVGSLKWESDDAPEEGVFYFFSSKRVQLIVKWLKWGGSGSTRGDFPWAMKVTLSVASLFPAHRVIVEAAID